MLYLCLAMILDVAIFTMGLTMSIIDVNKYNFGLYLVLMSVVTFSLLVALWVAKPKFCQTPPWAIQIYHSAVKSSRPNYHTSAGEAENLMERPNADEIMRSIKGIPLLIQAIQYSLEAAYVPTRDSTTAGPTFTDSAIESTVTTHDYYPNVTATDHSQVSSINENDQTLINDGNGKRNSNVKWQPPDRRVQPVPTRRRVADLKRQSIFVVFPYSETVPFDQAKLRMRRSSSEHDLNHPLHDRKSSFERFCVAAIAGENRTNSELRIPTDHTARSRSLTCEEKSDEERGSPLLKVDKRSEVRRPSIEVRYVGLQSILLEKMSAKMNNSS